MADPFRIVGGLRAYPGFIRDLRRYRSLERHHEVSYADLQPCFFERTATTAVDPHYVYQSFWALRRILSHPPRSHVDVGSDVAFVVSLAASVGVTFIDLRPLALDVPNLTSRGGSVTDLPFADGEVASLSCLHVAEHVGLGRYGDGLDAQGTERACHELARVLAPGGSLYFSVPVGRPRVCFNAHRVHSPAQILEYFGGLILRDFAGVDDDGAFREGIEPRALEGSAYACGLFLFGKSPTPA